MRICLQELVELRDALFVKGTRSLTGDMANDGEQLGIWIELLGGGREHPMAISGGHTGACLMAG